MHSSPHSKVQTLSLSALGFGSRTGAVIATCFAIATAHALGARWLSEPFAYLPAGMWIVGFALLLAHALETGAFAALAKMQRWSPLRATPISSTAIDRAVQPVVTRFHSVASESIDLVRSAAAGADRLSQRLSSRNDHQLHIGLDMTSADAAAVMLAADSIDPSSLGGVTVRFSRAEPGLVKDGPIDCERFDALLRRAGDNSLHLFVPERSDAPSAWSDWSNSGDLSFTGVFPIRLDCSRVGLGDADLANGAIASLVCRMAIAGAALGRTPARIGNTRGFLTGRSTLANFTRVVPAAILGVAEALVTIDPTRPAPCCKLAARLVSAFLATTHAESVGAVDRLHLIQTACGFIADEPEAALRLGAVQMSCARVDAATDAFESAATAIRRGKLAATSDPTPYILGEAELGGTDRLSYGRVCAGIALLQATSRAETMPYLHDDLLDDLAHAGWDQTRSDDLETVRGLLRRVGIERGASTSTGRRKLKKAA